MATDPSPTPSPETAVSDFAGQLFFRLWRASHTRIAAALESVGLTPARFGLLNLLGALEGANQQERRPHPKDRRAREVVLTARGRRLRERGRQMASQVEDEVLGGLTPAQRRDLLKLLRLANNTAPPQPPWRAEEGD